MGNKFERSWNAVPSDEMMDAGLVEPMDCISVYCSMFTVIYFFFKSRVRGLVFGAPPPPGPVYDWAEKFVSKNEAASTPCVR